MNFEINGHSKLYRLLKRDAQKRGRQVEEEIKRRLIRSLRFDEDAVAMVEALNALPPPKPKYRVPMGRKEWS